tara:strand:- start:896 stop:1084 length:189 start_codon:yes stop_codon:yes gene_type:complete
MKTLHNPHAKVYTEEEKVAWQIERAKLAEDIAKWSRPTQYKLNNRATLKREDDRVIRKAASL